MQNLPTHNSTNARDTLRVLIECMSRQGQLYDAHCRVSSPSPGTPSRGHIGSAESWASEEEPLEEVKHDHVESGNDGPTDEEPVEGLEDDPMDSGDNKSTVEPPPQDSTEHSADEEDADGNESVREKVVDDAGGNNVSTDGR